jgi:hypothetical protein
MSATVPTAAEIREMQAKVAEAAAEAERQRRASDRVVNLCPGINGMYAVTEQGRIFFRGLDERGNMNRPGTPLYKWVEVEGPLA